MSNPIIQKERDLKLQELRLLYEVDSIQDRIRDLEWRLDFIQHSTDGHKWRDERTAAIDKLRHTKRELHEVREQLLCVTKSQ